MFHLLRIGDSPRSFYLQGVDKKMYTVEQFKKDEILVIFFTCNNNPSNDVTAETVRKFKEKKIAFVGINTFLEDTVESMEKAVQEQRFPWFYLKDEDQLTAKSYDVKHLPTFFVYGKRRELMYKGKALDFPQAPEKSTINYLDQALEKILNGEKVDYDGKSSKGVRVNYA